MYASSYTMTISYRPKFIFLFAVIYVAIIFNDTFGGNDINGNIQTVSFGQAIRLSKQVPPKKTKKAGKEKNGKNVDKYSLPLKIDVKHLNKDNEDILRSIQQSLEQLINGKEARSEPHNDVNEYEQNKAGNEEEESGEEMESGEDMESGEVKESDEEKEDISELQLKKITKKKKPHTNKNQMSHEKKSKKPQKKQGNMHIEKDVNNSMLQMNAAKGLKGGENSLDKHKKGETVGETQPTFKVKSNSGKKVTKNSNTVTNKKSKTITNKKPSTPKKKGKKPSVDLKEDISTFVDVLDGLNTLTQKDDKAEVEKKHEVDEEEESEEKKDENASHQTEILFDGNDPDKNLYKKYMKKGKKNNLHTYVAMSSDYLGAGYDILFGNPLGDTVIKVDPGYRDSIIKLTYPKSDDDYPDNYKNMSANGSYIRYEVFCNRQEQFSSVHSIDEYMEEVGSDFSLQVDVPQAFAFSASHDYKQTSTTLADNKHTVLILKSYCNHYVASLSNFGQWKLSDQFQRAISLMPPYFNSQKHDKKVCDAAAMRNKFDPNSCGESVMLWLKFFKNFGTHVATLLHIGGKIVQKTTISDKTLNKYKLKSQDMSFDASVTVKSVDFGLGFSHGSKEEESSKLSQLDIMKEIIIVGGDTVFDPNKPKSFEHWSASVKKYPMPIKGTYVSIADILPSNLVYAYNEAFKFYVDLYAPVKTPKKKTPAIIEPNKINIRKLLKAPDVDVITKSGLGITIASCPAGKSIILGFSYSISAHRKEMYHIDMQDCAVGKSSCSSSSNDLAVYNYVFALCAPKTIPYLKQATTIEKQKSAIARCPSQEDAMLWGFGIVYNAANTYDVSVVPCTMADGICHINSPNELSYIATWIVCGHENYENLMFAMSLSKSATHPVDINRKIENGITCPNSALFTINIQFFENVFETQNGPCIQAWRGCLLNENTVGQCSVGTEPNGKTKKKKETAIAFRDYSIYHFYVY